MADLGSHLSGVPIRMPLRTSRGARLRRSAAWRTLGQNPLHVVGLVIVVTLVCIAVFADYLVPHDPLGFALRERFLPPSLEHPFGTDDRGRDVFSRVLAGTRISLGSALIILSMAVTVGCALGALAGFIGGALDEAIMRVTDIFFAFPELILALAINAALGPGLVSAWFAVAASWWPGYARMMRGQVLQVRHQVYVEAAQAIGVSRRRILLRHVIPNAIGPIIVQMTLDVGFVVLTMAGLSFLGLGAQPPQPEWGSMVAQGRSYILDQWWWATFPGLAMFTLVVGFNLVGDWLRETLDPQLARRG